MRRKVILAVVLAAVAGTAALASPPFRAPRLQPTPPPTPAAIEGWWYMVGDPRQPCFIQSVPGRWPLVVLTNERGEQSRGRVLPGQRIIADDWGSLIGDVRGGEIFWRNGDRWSR